MDGQVFKIIANPVDFSPVVCRVDVVHKAFELDVALQTPSADESSKVVDGSQQVLSGCASSIQDHVEDLGSNRTIFSLLVMHSWSARNGIAHLTFRMWKLARARGG